MNPYYTHREYLEEELSKVPKDAICLEFGTGEGSAPIFKKFAEENPEARIYSYESDYKWFTEIAAKYKALNYSINFVNDWNDFLARKTFDKIYDLIFVDQNPWVARIQTIKQLKNKGKVFILHDYDFFNKGFYDSDIFSVEKGSFFHTNFEEDFVFEPHKKLLPPTLVLRNKKFS
jgi:hypothetical protein